MRLPSSLCIMGLSILAILSPCSSFAAESDQLSASGAEVRKVADGFRFTEGPIWDAKNQALYFTDLQRENGSIFRWTSEQGAKLWRDQVRTIALGFDSSGTLFGTSGKGRAILKFDDQGSSTTIVSQYEGKRLNSPNDLWLDPRDGIYFSDPRYGNTSDVEQEGNFVFYLSPNRQQLVKVADGFARPNGIIGTLDGLKLYVADHGGGKTYVYDIQPDGSLANKKLFVEKGADGITMDEKGNVYLVTTAVEIYSPDGQLLQTIKVP